MNIPHRLIVAPLFLLGCWNVEVFGQVECTAPGNLRGIRVDGELMAFSTSIREVVPTAAEEGQGGRGRGGGGQFSREGGLDPSAHQYRAIFLEPWFCLNEIAQYVEICRIAQPLSILHWQLTADYSVLTGGRQRNACVRDRQSSRYAGDRASARRPRHGSTAAGQYELHEPGRESVNRLAVVRCVNRTQRMNNQPLTLHNETDMNRRPT